MKRMWSKNELKSIQNSLLASGEIPLIKGGEIIENMSGYSFSVDANSLTELNVIYAGVVKTGNKITFALFFTFKYDSGLFKDIGTFSIPAEIGAKIVPYNLDGEPLASEFAVDVIKARNEIPVQCYGELYHPSNQSMTFSLSTENATLTADATYLCRIEQTFLLSENLAPVGE